MHELINHKQKNENLSGLAFTHNGNETGIYNFVLSAKILPFTLKVKKSTIILLIITLYGVNYFLFERIFLFNELLSIIGITLFIKHSLQSDFKIKVPRSVIYRYVLLFILLGSIYATASVLLKTNWYYYFRNLSIVYSAFSFFVGYYLYQEQFEFFLKMRRAIYGYALICFAWMAPGIIDRNAYSFWFSLLQKNWKATSVLSLIVLYILYIVAYTSLTVIMILIAVVLIRYIKATLTSN